ncbi:MAG TPA: endo-1,4-beta-xylanase [Lacunisphaera sp.]|jgi:endo-1,4-beta-xylanase|nr:endo-1,4-beta-xylanase [Lacunisphaera sp.]
MKILAILRRYRLFLAAVAGLSLLSPETRAQLAAGQSKFLGNIISTSVPSNFATYWNEVTPENGGKWGTVESTRNVMNWTQLDTAYNFAKANGFKFKEHTLIWGAQYPTWLTSLSTADQRAEIEEWMSLLAARYPDLWAVDVVNEPVKTPLPFKDALGGDGATGWDWVITSFQLARKYFPNAKLFINEYGTENDATARGQMLTIINLLKARGLIDGIGIQSHYFNLDSMTGAQMTACLDAYAATGLDLYITELDMRGPLQNEASQASQYQAIFPAIWTHAAVKGVTLWGYIEGQTWKAGTGILNSDNTERAAMTWLKAYVTGTLTLPSITTQPSSQTATVGGNLSFSVTATGTAPLTYQWKLNGADISGATSSSYSISNVQASQAGNYTVTVSNVAGAVTSTTATLTVNAAPTPPPSSGGGGGGGGALSPWFLAMLALASLARLRNNRR